ncbi:CHRD domain-containing protein [Silvibacterium sp.]|uniref:CHRD domain-containing protein n=1 Tax=Silvibacterium sp. TaxID=1964179 RepID=UPI0039E53B15
MKLNRLFAASVIAMALGATAYADSIPFKADLKASSEVPPKDSSGTGTLTATLDTTTHEFKYHVEFSNLTGPVVAAHFHGPAGEGVNAKPQVPVKGSPISSPVDGTATLTPDQEKDLEDGKWYFNLHTKANPGGEIRGQIQKAQ